MSASRVCWMIREQCRASRWTRREPPRNSWKEQFGRILLEAMACGAAVVGSNSGEIPHLIERSGGGLVFPEGRPDKLAACLIRLLREPTLLEKHQTQGRTYVEQTLTHAIVARALVNKLGLGDGKELPAHDS